MSAIEIYERGNARARARARLRRVGAQALPGGNWFAKRPSITARRFFEFRFPSRRLFCPHIPAREAASLIVSPVSVRTPRLGLHRRAAIVVLSVPPVGALRRF